MRILLVKDDGTASVLKNTLTKQNYLVALTTDGQARLSGGDNFESTSCLSASTICLSKVE